MKINSILLLLTLCFFSSFHLFGMEKTEEETRNLRYIVNLTDNNVKFAIGPASNKWVDVELKPYSSKKVNALIPKAKQSKYDAQLYNLAESNTGPYVQRLTGSDENFAVIIQDINAYLKGPDVISLSATSSLEKIMAKGAREMLWINNRKWMREIPIE